jgi:hypothetical protein
VDEIIAADCDGRKHIVGSSPITLRAQRGSA